MGEHGVFIGATMRSNATKAAEQSGMVHDPMAMLPFTGCNIKDYFGNWLGLETAVKTVNPAAEMPKVFHVNWFRKGPNGDFLWPGFAENCRVLAWVLGRCGGTSAAKLSPIGYLPAPGSLDISGLDLDGANEASMSKLFSINQLEWAIEAAEARKYFYDVLMSGDRTPLPAGLIRQLEALERRLGLDNIESESCRLNNPRTDAQIAKMTTEREVRERKMRSPVKALPDGVNMPQTRLVVDICGCTG